MKNKYIKWFLSHSLTVISCALITGAGIAFVVWATAPTTIIGHDITTRNIFTTGNVGIGDTTPDSRLDVEGGDIRISTPGRGLIVDGVLLNTIRSANLGEDTYGTWRTHGGAPDTCDGRHYSAFTCHPTQTATCVDVDATWDPFPWEMWFYYERDVQCIHNRTLSVN